MAQVMLRWAHSDLSQWENQILKLEERARCLCFLSSYFISGKTAKIHFNLELLSQRVLRIPGKNQIAKKKQGAEEKGGIEAFYILQ